MKQSLCPEPESQISRSENELSRAFNENLRFHSVHADTERKIFRVDSRSFPSPLYFRFCDVTRFELFFFREQTRGTTAVGSIVLRLETEDPPFCFEETLARAAVRKGENGVFPSPCGMDEFSLKFITAWRDAVYGKADREFGRELSPATTAQEFDDRKKRLVKTFQLIQQINVAYESFKSRLH